MPQNKEAAIDRIISDMCSSVPGLQAVFIVDDEGTSLAKAFSDEISRSPLVDEDSIGKLTITAFHDISGISRNASKGSVDIIIVKTSDGAFFMREIRNPETSACVRIIVFADSIIPIELALLHIKKSSRQIARII
ncbi:MAG: roadblock/LC7 domain-containing protein [Candidatus Hodarchaeales archaeon]|jgi:predicted regulator of Ras-like GTPase activity (Roadblock/LC7/MglB family)